MKTSVRVFAAFAMIVLYVSLLVSCKKPDNDNPPPGTASRADSISDQLQFFNAIKKQGQIPVGPASSSLKISFEDTLYLTDEIKRPFKFLHEDTTKNVSGVYVQVHGGAIGGSFASYYYDVPELKETSDNDTVSTILIGVDPVGLEDLSGVPPAGGDIVFVITLIPYGKNKEPLAMAVKPVKVSDSKVDQNGNSGSCSIITAPGDYWDWEMSYISDPNNLGEFLFLNSPDKTWGTLGQDISGSCCNGISVYGICIGDTIPNARLHFNSLFNYSEEIFKFIGGGTFARYTSVYNVAPDPNSSNFCGTGDGVVREEFLNVFYQGNWTINRLANPVNGDSLSLTLQGTSTVPVGGGYGNPGGRIHILDCYLLVLIQPDNERAGRELVKFYNYRDVHSPYWYPFN